MGNCRACRTAFAMSWTWLLCPRCPDAKDQLPPIINCRVDASQRQLIVEVRDNEGVNWNSVTIVVNGQLRTFRPSEQNGKFLFVSSTLTSKILTISTFGSPQATWQITQRVLLNRPSHQPLQHHRPPRSLLADAIMVPGHSLQMQRGKELTIASFHSTERHSSTER